MSVAINNSTFERYKSCRSHYTKIPNNFIRNSELSDAGFRLVSWILSQSENFNFNSKTIREAFGWGRDKFRDAVKNAVEFGCLVQVQVRGERGTFLYRHIAFDDLSEAEKFKAEHLPSAVDGKSVHGDSTVDVFAVDGLTVDGKSVHGDLIEEEEKYKEEKKSENSPPPPKEGVGSVCETEGKNFEDLKTSDSQHSTQFENQETSNLNPPVTNPNPKTPPCLDSKKSGEDQKCRGSALFYSVPLETLDRIKALYNSKKPNAWQPVSNFYRVLKEEVRGVISSEDFQGDAEAFLKRLEDALSELSHPGTSFGWWSHQANKSLMNILRDGWLFRFSDAWTARQQKPENQEQSELPDYLKRLAAELALKKAG